MRIIWVGGIGERVISGVLTPTTPATRVQDRHRPDHEAAPVVAREDRALDAEHVEQADQVAAQVVDVVGADRLGPVAAAVAALVGRDHPEARGDQCVELVAPR
jgi:hypothetical protein